MKKLLLFILIPLLSFNVSSEPKSIVGKWKGEDEKNEIGFMTFDKDGFATIEAGGETYGGKEFTAKGKKGSMTYVINFDIEPVQLDLTITLLETKEQMKMLMIAKFKDDDTMTLASNFNSDRPTEFSVDNSITLHRLK